MTHHLNCNLFYQLSVSLYVGILKNVPCLSDNQSTVVRTAAVDLGAAHATRCLVLHLLTIHMHECMRVCTCLCVCSS